MHPNAPPTDPHRVDTIPTGEYRAWREGFRAGQGVHRGALLSLAAAVLLAVGFAVALIACRG